jgi:hypothetical protein
MSENNSATAAEGTGTQAETTSEETLSIEWIRDFATQWIDAGNSHEVNRLLALMSEDIEYRDDAWPKPMRGHADVREFLEAIWRAFPDITVELLAGHVIPGEPRAAIGAAGHPTGPRPGWLRAHRPPLGTGRRRLTQYRDGAFASCASRSTCYSRQLGLMPRRAAAERAGDGASLGFP